MVQRADVDRYPPVLHQMRELSRRSKVTVLDRANDDSCAFEAVFTDVRRVRIRPGKAPLPLRNATELLSFSRELDRELAAGSSIAIGYDPDAAALLLRSTHGDAALKRVVHLHELPDPSTAGRITRQSIRYLVKHLERADLVLVPDRERARIVADTYSLSRMPLVVMNCPMTMQRIPDSRLVPLLRQRGFGNVRVVHYQGSVGPDHYLEQIVLSMKCWPSDAIFVIVGGGSEKFNARLRFLAQSVGVEDRLVLVGRVPYAEVMSYAVGATLAITLLEPTIDNQRFCAGASNKRFEYAALGIAQIANADPGMDEIFGYAGIAKLLSIIDANTIGETVMRLLADPLATRTMGERARIAHLRENNYEAQFAPVIQTIESWLADHA